MIHTNSVNTNKAIDRKTPPTIIVIFGASGDLTARKLVPAIFNLSKDELLPKRCFLVGYGRSEMADENFKNEIKNALNNHSRRNIEDSIWNNMKDNLFFHAGAYDDLNSFVQLEKKISNIE